MRPFLILLALVAALAFASSAAAKSAPPVTCSGNSTSLTFHGLPLDANIGITVNAYPITPGGFYWPINLNNTNGSPDETLPFTEWPGPGIYSVRVEERTHHNLVLLGSCLVTI